LFHLSNKLEADASGEALSELKVDELGLEQLDREYLSMITQKFGGGPVGLDTLSTAIGVFIDAISWLKFLFVSFIKQT
jgi:Holliday junction resolvasome RuvABC ATP-dependent DNA helicase subunit